MTAAPPDHHASLRRLAHAAAAWLLARAVVAVAWALTSTDRFRSSEAATTMRDEALFMWDGTYYRELARHGYAALDADVQRFFPGYHLAGRAVGWLLGDSDLGLLAVANVSALAAGWLVATLVAEATGDEPTAVLSAWWTALFPAAAVMSAAYGEALTIAVGAGALLAAQRGRWPVAAALGVAAGLMRPTGLLMVIPLAFAAWPTVRSADRPAAARWTAGAAVVAPVAGAAAYAGWLWATFGTWAEPVEAQRRFRDGWHEPVTRLVRAVVDVAGGSFADGYNLAFAVAAIVALAASWRRVPVGWTAYVGVTLAVTLAANNVNSLGRYALAAFPLAAMLAVLSRRLGRRHAWFDASALAASALCLGVYCLAAWSGRMIP